MSTNCFLCPKNSVKKVLQLVGGNMNSFCKFTTILQDKSGFNSLKLQIIELINYLVLQKHLGLLGKLTYGSPCSLYSIGYVYTFSMSDVSESNVRIELKYKYTLKIKTISDT